MATRLIESVFRHVEAFAAREQNGTHTDGDLYQSFLRDGNQAPFATLVHRHGPMVWGVCRNLLPEADAEDAFQATFLALVRAGNSIQISTTLGGWLHRVAVQVCRRARRTGNRRRLREARVAVPEIARPGPDVEWQDLHAAVHEEIDRLPHRQRAVFVLCGLEGVRPTDAAPKLGLRVSTVTGLLSRARQRILARLKDRQFLPGLTGGVMALAVSGSAAAVPPELFDLAVSMARPDFAAGASSVVLGLARHALETPMIRWKILAAVALVGTALSASVGGILATSAAQAPLSTASHLQLPSTQLQIRENDSLVPEGGEQGPTIGLAQSRNGTGLPPTESRRPQWEYRIIPLPVDAQGELNKRGSEGWELVAVDRSATGVGTAYLKRPVVGGSTTASSSSTTSGTGTSSTVPSGPKTSANASSRSTVTPFNKYKIESLIDPNAPESYSVIRLQRLSTATAAALVKELYKGKAGFEGVTADPETNSLILRGTATTIKQVKSTIEKLDNENEEGPSLTK
jgi:RNA polymerase sigma factor (sigma-70 family)